MSEAKPTKSSHNPEDWPGRFTKHLDAGELEAVTELYEPDARIVTRTGDTLVGRDRIRDVLAGMIRAGMKLKSRVIQTVVVGEIGLLYTDFEGTSVDSSGQTVEARFKAIEILRRQPDGTWKLIMGDPNGRR